MSCLTDSVLRVCEDVVVVETEDLRTELPLGDPGRVAAEVAVLHSEIVRLREAMVWATGVR